MFFWHKMAYEIDFLPMGEGGDSLPLKTLD